MLDQMTPSPVPSRKEQARARAYRVAATVGSVVVVAAALGAPWKW